jgi:hypothetical protein
MPAQLHVRSISRLGGAALLAMVALPAHALSPVILERVTGTYDVQENGGYTNIISTVIAVTSEAAAAGMGQFPISYSPSWQPDGRLHLEMPKNRNWMKPLEQPKLEAIACPANTVLIN